MLSCYRVLDLTNENGFLCGKALGDLGDVGSIIALYHRGVMGKGQQVDAVSHQ